MSFTADRRRWLLGLLLGGVTVFLAAGLGLHLRRAARQAQAGFALSFDDRSSIESWGQARAFLKERGLRATFFVDRIDALTPGQLQILRDLASDGHEIGCHGFRHLDARRFLDTGGTVEEYLRVEIQPAVDEMRRLGFPVRSFAYPHGKFTPETDQALRNQFAMIRKAEHGNPLYDGRDGPQTTSFYIDRANPPREKLESLARQARKAGMVASVSGHKIGPAGGNYWCSFETLDVLCSAARRHDLKFYTMSELAGRARLH